MTIGTQWHGQATVAPAVQQRLVSAIEAEVVGSRVVDATARARGEIAASIERDRYEALGRWTAALDEAAAAYRAAQIEEAAQVLALVLEQTRADPTVPGAAQIAWRAWVLRGQLASTQGDVAAQDEAFAAAVALDPQARLSTRTIPPALVAAYEQRRAAVIAERDEWPRIELRGVELDGGGRRFGVEIDGRVGWTQVPPGEHYVVVRRPGLPPTGAVVHTEQPWTVPESAAPFREDFVRNEDAAQALCDAGGLDRLVLARMRGRRLGLQGFVCGEGFTASWYERADGWADGVTRVVGSAGVRGTMAVLHEAAPWPSVAPPKRARPWWPPDGGAPPSARQRFVRALPWVLLSGVVAGAVTVGVVLGTESTPDLRIDGDDFVGR